MTGTERAALAAERRVLAQVMRTAVRILEAPWADAAAGRRVVLAVSAQFDQLGHALAANSDEDPGALGPTCEEVRAALSAWRAG